MKKLISIVFVLALMLTGCTLVTPSMRDPAPFYYPLAEYRYEEESPVISTENREISGHRESLSHILALYLMGPTDAQLVSPLPLDTKLVSLRRNEREILVTLSETGDVSDIQLVLAAACISKTCLGLGYDAPVTLVRGSQRVSLTPQQLLLFDDNTQFTPYGE